MFTLTLYQRFASQGFPIRPKTANLCYNFRDMAQDFTVEEVATRLKVHKRTVRNWLNRKDLIGYRLGEKGPWRITEKAISEFLGVELEELDLD